MAQWTQRMASGRFLARKRLVRDSLVEEPGHQTEGSARFGKLEVIPEGVGQGFANHQLRVIVGAQQSTMENRGVAQQQVARAGDQQGWRHAAQIREDRRQNGVLWIPSWAHIHGDVVCSLLGAREFRGVRSV